MLYRALLEDFLQCLGLVAIISIAYGFFIQMRSSSVQTFLTGVSLALGAVVSMALPVRLGDELLFDLRHVFLLIASTYAGLPGLLLTWVAASAFRLWMGGAAVYAGLCGIAILAVTGLYIAQVFRDLQPWRRAFFLGSSSVFSLLSVFVLPWEMAVAVLSEVAIPLTIANFFGVLLSSLLLEIKRARRAREVSLEVDARFDALTGLRNRRTFDRLAPRLISRELQHGRSLAVLLVDIDRFKNVNDRFGHEAGDEVLKAVAKALEDTVRVNDLVARYGGEEFAIVLTDCDAAAAESVCRRFWQHLARRRFHFQGEALVVTISAGYHVVTNGCAASLAELLRRADAALYVVKTNGRNRVVNWASGEAIHA